MRRLIGSRLAFILGTLGMLSAFNDIGSGRPPGSTALLAGPIMVLGASAYSSRKRRLLGLKPGTAVRKTFEGVCLGFITTMWLGFPDVGDSVITTVWLGFPSFANAVQTDPASQLIIPLWALIAYPCAHFRVRRHLDAAPPTERTSSRLIRTVLWSVPVAIALSIGGTAALAGIARASHEPPAYDELDPDGLSAAVGFRCSFAEMGLDMAVDEVSFEGENRFGTARLIGNTGAVDMTAVREFTGGSMSFIEITSGGSVHLLTVYALRRVDGAFEAVYSRHFGFMGFPGASHDEGPCRDVW